MDPQQEEEHPTMNNSTNAILLWLNSQPRRLVGILIILLQQHFLAAGKPLCILGKEPPTGFGSKSKFFDDLKELKGEDFRPYLVWRRHSFLGFNTAAIHAWCHQENPAWRIPIWQIGEEEERINRRRKKKRPKPHHQSTHDDDDNVDDGDTIIDRGPEKPTERESGTGGDLQKTGRNLDSGIHSEQPKHPTAKRPKKLSHPSSFERPIDPNQHAEQTRPVGQAPQILSDIFLSDETSQPTSRWSDTDIHTTSATAIAEHTVEERPREKHPDTLSDEHEDTVVSGHERQPLEEADQDPDNNHVSATQDSGKSQEKARNETETQRANQTQEKTPSNDDEEEDDTLLTSPRKSQTRLRRTSQEEDMVVDNEVTPNRLRTTVSDEHEDTVVSSHKQQEEEKAQQERQNQERSQPQGTSQHNKKRQQKPKPKPKPTEKRATGFPRFPEGLLQYANVKPLKDHTPLNGEAITLLLLYWIHTFRVAIPDNVQLLDCYLCAVSAHSEQISTNTAVTWTVFPVNLDDMHWVAAFAYVDADTIYICDSMLSERTNEAKSHIRTTIQTRVKQRPRAPRVKLPKMLLDCSEDPVVKVSSWSVVKQKDAWSCGIHTAWNIVSFLRHVKQRPPEKVPEKVLITQFSTMDGILAEYDTAEVQLTAAAATTTTTTTTTTSKILAEYDTAEVQLTAAAAATTTTTTTTTTSKNQKIKKSKIQPENGEPNINFEEVQD